MRKDSSNMLMARLAVAAATNPKGFTYNIQENAFQTQGFAVALAATQNSFGPEGFLRVVKYAKKNHVSCVGGWFDNKTGLYYFDATVIVADRKEAIALGKKNGQLAVYDLNKKHTIRINYRSAK